MLKIVITNGKCFPKAAHFVIGLLKTRMIAIHDIVNIFCTANKVMV